ncbi:MAG TPA: efflux RND transporter periplasmic adaptor subunit [Candidatus Methylomirabilis sp.]|nr:efflux RND transporter periplasmic adaptor subunit [Candidatus Methylomirabilis sp.]
MKPATGLDTRIAPEAMGEREPSRAGRRRRLSTVVVFLVAGLLAVGIVPRVRRATELRADVEGPQNRHLAVSVVVPRPGPASTDLDLPGNIQAIQETPIYARVDGYLRHRSADIGDRVERGQVLAEIDTPELDQQVSQAEAAVAQARAALAQTQASLQQAKANLELARISAERWAALLADRAVARQDVDERRSQYDAARASTDAAQATVDATRANVAASAANLQRLRALESFKQVVAPYGGIVTARTVDRGALITAGSGGASVPLFRIAQVDTLRILVNVPQTFVRSIAPGQQTRIVVREFPGRVFAGKVSRDANALDPTSRTLLTEVQVPNTDLALRPGMYAQVKFSVVGPDPPLLIPATALVIRGAGPQVVVVRQDNTAHYQPVELGRDLGASVEVVSGLQGNERLVVNVPDGLNEGISIRPQAGEHPDGI